ncbi:SGNH/GDSL hydrolase family protein [Rhodococcus sp. SORGH_AS_0303]|uniref:SGNH/GDSL hydrolase family protein n=1 Tax=Rhodococcus sp. SORGH_AS_0303 TaxID=3041753 RepID=UPI002787A24C|nr:SGNH/GDSL hydrolase family protein [Rhodococcus sp. SORGH_AS_0303]MDQ1203319.1 lysophospholipase L1-like esterase [Rhodococcus sp. SORGH_AS_0303]
MTATTESGFVAQNQGSTSRTYLDGSGSAVLTSPDLVIVQGSSNDTDPDAVAAASAELFSELREKLPDASLIAIAPVSPPSRDVAVAMNVTTALRTSAEQFSVPLVEPIRDGWFTDPVVNFLPDGINLSLDGQQTYAARLKLELDKLGIPRMYSCEPIEGQ